MNAPNLPQVAASMLKSVIVGMVTAGLIAESDAASLLCLLGLQDA